MKPFHHQLVLKHRSRSLLSDGFTLPELLVATLIAAAIAAITGQVMIGQLLEERRLEVAQRLREDVSRLNYLIQIEASESESVELAGANPAGCPGGGEAFTLVVPRPIGTYADNANLSRIQYYNAPDPNDNNRPAIWRCGPPVTRNGVLRHDANPLNTAGVVMRNAQLDRDPAGCPASTLRSVTYRVVPAPGLEGANLGNLGGCTTAHARSVFVCNPPIIPPPPDVYVPQVGDCPLPP